MSEAWRRIALLALPRVELAPAAAEAAGAVRAPRIAESRAARRRGLARLSGLAAEDALLLPRCRSVHTFGMRCALDLVWLGASGAVVRVDAAVPPRRLRTCLRASSVLEIPVGARGPRGPSG